MKDYDTAVIGGGVTGLVAAYKLLQAGHSVILFEPAHLGGLINSRIDGAFTFELGPNVLMDKSEIMGLIGELGLNKNVKLSAISDYRQLVWVGGRAQVVPRSFWQFLGSSLLKLSDKLRIIAKLFQGAIAIPEDNDQSVAEFLGKIFGPKLVASVIDPALRGIYGGDINQLSARSLFPEFWEEMRKGHSVFGYLKNKRRAGKRSIFVLAGGNEQLVIKLSQIVTAHASVVADSVSGLFHDRASSVYTIKTWGGTQISVKHVCIATSGASTASYLSGLDRELSNVLMGVRYAPIAVVHLVTNQIDLIPHKAFGVLFPTTDPSPLMGVMFNSNLFPHVSPLDQQILTVCLGGVKLAGKIEKISDEELCNYAIKGVTERLKIENLDLFSLQRYTGAIPQYEVGHWQVVEEMERAESRYFGLKFLGADLGGVGVPDRVAVAVHGVEDLLNRISLNGETTSEQPPVL